MSVNFITKLVRQSVDTPWRKHENFAPNSFRSFENLIFFDVSYSDDDLIETSTFSLNNKTDLVHFIVEHIMNDDTNYNLRLENHEYWKENNIHRTWSIG